MSGKPHGAVKYSTEGCRCDVCREASNAAHRARRRRIAYGQVYWTDAEPVRVHVRAQMAAGLGWIRHARLAGVQHAVVQRLLYGDRKTPPTRKMRPENASRLLAVYAGMDTLAPSALIDATGTRRRLQALVVAGWSQRLLARHMGVHAANLGPLLTKSRVTVRTALAVRALFTRLWDRPPPQVSTAEKAAVSKARNVARRHGWVPALAWDDIDNPAETPQGAGWTRTRAPEDVAWLDRCGVTDERIAERLGVQRDTVVAMRRKARAA